jgi:methionyl-tRNA formyltransferase
MRIFLLANNIVGLKVLKFLKSQKEDIIALGIHEKDKQKYTAEIIKASGLSKKHIFKAKSLRDQKTLEKIKKLKPDIIISAFWGYILKPELFNIPPQGTINFHPGYLPYNRGVNPNVWPFVENTPAGVTIHYIDEGTDTGNIIARKKVKIRPTDTAGTINDITLLEIVKLFIKTWPLIKSGKNKSIPQKNLGKTTFHKIKDLEILDTIDLNKKYRAIDLINFLRSRSYPDRFYAHYFENGKKVFVRIELSDGK